jgi:hemolysin activation/secretion protein
LHTKNEGGGRSLARNAATLWLVVACALPWPAPAQVVPTPPGRLPSQQPLPPPEFKQPAPEFELPKPVQPPPERVPYILRVYVRAYRIVGNTVFSEAELQKIAAPYTNREITNVDLEELRQKLTEHYIKHGYINSGAVIPDQKIENGVIEIRIVEGRLSRIDVEGTKYFKKDYFSDRLELHSGPPLNVNDLEEELKILLQNPLVSRINAQLAPGAAPGEAVLKTDVTEAPRYDFAVQLDNKLSPVLGEEEMQLYGQVNNFLGNGDVLSAQFIGSEGIHSDYTLRYDTPISPTDLALGVYYEHTQAVVVQDPYNQLDIRSTYKTVGAQLSKPVYRTANRQLALGAVLEHRESDTSLLGQPFSFSPGVQDGKATVSVLRLVQDYLDRGRDQVLAARSTLSVGLNAFGSTINPDAPDSQFLAWLGQGQWVQRIGERGDTLVLRADVQLANHALLPLEQFSVGGLDSVRGYRTNQLVRDSGYTGTVEYRIPVFADQAGPHNLQFSTYVDTGSARYKSAPNPSPSYLTGVGVGLLWDPGPKYHAELYFAHGLDNVPYKTGHSLQDDSIYFRFVVHPFAKP